MSNVMVMHRNFISSDLLTDQQVSSELGIAPATNLYDRIRRTKVWRSEGYFEVTSSNKAIIFRETVGVDLTATITEDEYTSDSDFLAAVKAALEAAGASTYTVSRNSTSKKIVIASDGLGGGGIFQLKWTNVLSTAYDLLGFSNGADRTGALTYTADSIRIHTSEWVRWDLGTATEIQAFAMIGTRLNGLGISSTATVTLQGNSTDVWTSPSYSQALSWNEDCMALIDSSGLDTLRYWRIKIVDRDNPTGYIEVASVYLGELIEPTSGCVQFPMETQRVDYSKRDRSEWGQPFGETKQITRKFKMQWAFLSVTEKEELEEVLELYKTTNPFWMALDNNEAFTSDSQLMVFQGYFDELPDFTLRKPGKFESDWTVLEAV